MSNVPVPDTLEIEAVNELASQALTSDDPLTRKHAIYLLGMIRNPAYIEIFIQALRDPEKAVRAQATRALADIGEAASERLITFLGDLDWKVRYRAAEALGMMKENRAVRSLIKLLSDDKDHVRYSAVKALGEIGAKESLEYLIQMDDNNVYVMRMVESVITKFNTD